jgi:hypothetical protein
MSVRLTLLAALALVLKWNTAAAFSNAGPRFGLATVVSPKAPNMRRHLISPLEPIQRAQLVQLFAEPDDVNKEKTPDDVNMEKTWRYIKKTLLRVGSKGATTSHGNSLKEILTSHKVVKVKMNGLRGSES